MRHLNHILAPASVTVLSLTLLCGCRFSMLDLGPRKLTTHYFELRTPPGAPVTGGAWLKSRTLAVDPLQTDSRYDDRFYLVKPGHEVTLSENRRWVRPPGDLVTSELQEAVGNSGLCGNVIGAGSSLRPDLRLSGNVVRFDLEEGAGETLTAVLQLRLTLSLDTGAGTVAGQKIIWQKHLTATEPVAAGADPAACAAAMSTATARVIQELLRDLAALPAP